jgi:hypothetical protein
MSSSLSTWPLASAFLAVTNLVGAYGGAHCLTTSVPTERNMNCHNTHNEMQKVENVGSTQCRSMIITVKKRAKILPKVKDHICSNFVN